MSESKKSSPLLTVGCVFLGLVLVAVIVGGIFDAQPIEQTYPFVGIDHPISIWHDGKDKWAYYSVGTGTVPEMAAKAKAALLPMGFREDHSEAPWVRFLKDDVEVMVCRHRDLSMQGGKLIHPPNPLMGSPSQWPCILVKNGPGSGSSLLVFQIRKLIHGW